MRTFCGPRRQPLGLDDAQEAAVDEEGVVGRAVGGGVFGDGVVGVGRGGMAGDVGDDGPALLAQERIDPLAACYALRFLAWDWHKMPPWEAAIGNPKGHSNTVEGTFQQRAKSREQGAGEQERQSGRPD